ncbi:hypothetical protein DER46DRAFT_72947 [Fusarium sp. MPI-SDFR-AT-0072]|nr:hypothetical protein DER46DRAFT_72947 [Fusarium sp. MPI-SDFR-AT-0072]
MAHYHWGYCYPIRSSTIFYYLVGSQKGLNYRRGSVYGACRHLWMHRSFSLPLQAGHGIREGVPRQLAIWERLGRLTGKVNRRLQKLLELLASADTKLKQRHLKQFLAALIDPEQYEERVTGLRGLGRELVEAADVCGHESGYERCEEQKKLLQSLQEPFRRVDERVVEVLRKLQPDELQQVVESNSTTPVGTQQNARRRDRSRNTCEWLVQDRHFITWEESSFSSVFWLQGYGKLLSIFCTVLVFSNVVCY